jgi:serine/threonine protein kinase
LRDTLISLRGLSHPNICNFYHQISGRTTQIDNANSASGGAIVMEYIDGQTLEEFLCKQSRFIGILSSFKSGY